MPVLGPQAAIEHFSVAQNPLRSDEIRKNAWRLCELELWYAAVHHGRLRLCDLEPKWQQPVYDLIKARMHALAG